MSTEKNLFLLTEKVICVWTRGQNIQENIIFAKYLQKCGHSLSRKKYIRCLFHFIPLQLQQESWLITCFCSKASSSLQQCFVLNHRKIWLMFTTHKILKAGEKKRRFLRVCPIRMCTHTWTFTLKLYHRKRNVNIISQSQIYYFILS